LYFHPFFKPDTVMIRAKAIVAITQQFWVRSVTHFYFDDALSTYKALGQFSFSRVPATATAQRLTEPLEF